MKREQADRQGGPEGSGEQAEIELVNVAENSETEQKVAADDLSN